jgi:hypothetical protein
MPVYWVLGYGIVTIDLNNDKNDRLRKIIAALSHERVMEIIYF